MITKYCFIMFSYILKWVLAYSNNLYAIVPRPDDGSLDCGESQNIVRDRLHQLDKKKNEMEFFFQTIKTTTKSSEDPFFLYQSKKLELLLGSKVNGKVLLSAFKANISNLAVTFISSKKVLSISKKAAKCASDSPMKGSEAANSEEDVTSPLPLAKSFSSAENEDDLAHYPSGSIMRAELFQNKSGVHMPMPELIHRDHCYLKLTDDYMQTAVDAFAIFLHGSVADVLNLPSSYVLRSARTIAMMNIEREKLVSTWAVVKGDLEPQQISYQVLEMYRPLFKYLSGREIARLNLTDERILTFIGTHPDLDRHQVGVTAAKYLRLNPNWWEPRYLNLMNNLLCGVPLTFMRKIAETTYLQLTQQVFYHIRACDPIQRRFYLTMMTKTQALGKSYSWSARDVARLGLLLTEVKGSDLATVSPEAMAGITAQVMLEMPERSLKYFTEFQLRYLGHKPLNVYAKRLKIYQETFTYRDSTEKLSANGILYILCILNISK